MLAIGLRTPQALSNATRSDGLSHLISRVTVIQELSSFADSQALALNLDLTDEQLKQARTSGLVVNNSVPSSVGSIRVVVQDRSSGAAGSMRLQLAKKIHVPPSRTLRRVNDPWLRLRRNRGRAVDRSPITRYDTT